MHRSDFRGLALAGAVWTMVLNGDRVHAQNEPLPESVRNGLVAYRELDSLGVTWSGSTVATPLGRAKIPAARLNTFISATNNVYQLAFREGRLYQRCERNFDGSSKPYADEHAFDGTVLYGGHPGPAQPNAKERPVLTKWLPTKDEPEANYWVDDYFRAAGVRLATRNRELILPWRPRSELLSLLSETGHVVALSETELDGRPVIRVQVLAPDLRTAVPRSDQSAIDILEGQLGLNPKLNETEVQRQLKLAKRQGRPPLKRRFEFFLDPKIAYAVRRFETRDDDGRLLTRSDCTEHEQLHGRALWLPRLCRVEQYTFQDLHDEETLVPYVFPSPLYVSEFRVTTFDVKRWPDERFVLQYAPGTNVNDATLPGTKGQDGISYRLPADPQQLENVIAKAQAEHQARLSSATKTSWIRILFLVLNGIVAIGVAAFFLARRRRRPV
jgi:hypothetical protein